MYFDRKDKLIIFSNLFILGLFLYSLILLKNYNISYGEVNSSKYAGQGYDSWYMFSSLFLYFSIIVILIFSIRTIILRSHLIKKQKISVYVILNLILILISIFVNFILNHYPYPSYSLNSNYDYIVYPYRNFLEIIVPVNYIIIIIVIALSISDFYSKINNYTDIESNRVRNIYNENTFNVLKPVLATPDTKKASNDNGSQVFINRHNQVNYSNSCPKCGNHILSSDAFCQNCGKRI